MSRGPKKRDPIFDRSTALLLRERYLQGETYKSIGESIDETPSRISHAMTAHGVISKEDTSEHYRVINQKRREAGIRVGRKSDYMKKREQERKKESSE